VVAEWSAFKLLSHDVGKSVSSYIDIVYRHVDNNLENIFLYFERKM
jgi:hypothetical protein